MNATNPTIPTPQAAQAAFEQQIASLDPQRAQSLAGLSRLRTVKAAMLKRDQLRATQKYGAKDPLVAALQAQQTLNNQLQTEVAYRATLAATAVPVASPQGYIFYGTVLDATRKPQAGLTVGLFDQSGAWIRDLGYGCTDANGAFTLSYQALAETGVHVNAGIAMTGAQVNVTGPDKKLLYRSTTPLYPKPGTVDYRLIVLSADAVCTLPSPATTEREESAVEMFDATPKKRGKSGGKN